MSFTSESRVIAERVWLNDDDEAVINLPTDIWWEFRKDSDFVDGKEYFTIVLLLKDGKSVYDYKNKKQRDADYEGLRGAK